MNPEFWNGKRVLMTGHTGFKGAWLSLLLQRLRASLTGYALAPPTEPNLFTLANVQDGMTSILGDIRDLDNLCEVCHQVQPEIIIHMAAQSVVRISYEDPVNTYATNVMGTVHILEAARHTPSVRVVVNVTSDKCYDNQGWYWGYRESDRLGGHDPYSNSKGCSELITEAYRKSFFATKQQDRIIAVGTGRAGNVIGGGDWTHDQLIPDVIRAILANKVLCLRNPQAIRPWQYVLEPLRGYLMLAEKLWEGHPRFTNGWNFGPAYEDAKPVQWIVENIFQRWGENQHRWISENANHPHEETYLKLDSSRANKLLAWVPVIRIEKALDLTVDWYKSYQSKNDIRYQTLDQVERYKKLFY